MKALHKSSKSKNLEVIKVRTASANKESTKTHEEAEIIACIRLDTDVVEVKAVSELEKVKSGEATLSSSDSVEW